MEVIYKTRTNPKYPSTVYGRISDAKTGELLVAAIDEYCRDVIRIRGWVVISEEAEE